MIRLHVVDGTYELYRAHFSKRPGHNAPDGQDVKATVGLVSSMLALLQDGKEAVTHLAVAFDNPIRSFRNDLYAGYKSDEGVPPELRAQFDLAEEALRALGIVVWSMKTHETDDALATAAHRFASEVAQVRIVACDKDMLQCVHGDKVVMVDRARDRLLDEAYVRKERGVPPSAIPDLLALTGDSADGIPGLPGFGDKSAAALLSAFERLEQIPDDPASWPKSVRGAARLAGVLREQREDALLYKTLTTLKTDVPLREDLEGLRFTGTPRAEWEAFCDRLGLRTLRPRPDRWR